MAIYSKARPDNSQESSIYSKAKASREKPLHEITAEKDTIYNRAKNYFKQNKFGEALVQQMKSGGFAGVPTATPEQAKTIAKETLKAGLVEGVAAAYAPAYAATGIKSLKALLGVSQAGVSGATVATAESLVEKGELPKSEELVKEGALWAGIDAALQLVHLTTGGVKNAYKVNKAVGDIAEKEGIPKVEVWKRLWKSTKNYAQNKFGRKISNPEDVTAADAEVLVKEAERAEKEGIKAITYEEPKQIEFKPKEKVSATAPKIEPPKNQPVTNKTESEKPPLSATKERLSRPFKISKPEYKNYEISRFNPSNGEYTKENVEGSVYAIKTPQGKIDVFGLRKTDKKSAQDKGYIVEHVPSGISIHHFKGKDEAKEFINWLSENGIKDIRKIGEKDKKSLLEALDKNKTQHHLASQKEKSRKRSIKEKPKSEILAEETNREPEHQKDFTPAMMEKQKDYIIDKIDKAISNPSTDKRITIKVPQDGVLTINNSPDNLKLAKQRVENNWPVKSLASGKGKPLQHRAIAGPAKLKEEKEKPLSRKGQRIPPAETRERQPQLGKEQAAKRSEILNILRKAFHDPIRLGKFRQKAAGIHKGWPKVSRLLNDNDIETAAHEIGHNIHYTLYGGDAKSFSAMRRNTEKALAPHLDELKPLAHYEPYTLEGFAEFTRLYVTNPIIAKRLAPKFYIKFENDLQSYPEMKNALLQSREYYEKYLQGTPLSRIEAQTDYADDNSKLDNLIESFKSIFNLDFLKTQFLDDIFPAKRVVAEAFGIPVNKVENLKDPRNLYRSLRVLKGAIGKADVYAMFETFDALTLKKTGKGLREILSQLKDDTEYREFNDYLIARRAVEKSGQKIETGINLGDARVVIKDLGAKYDNLAQQLDHYNDQLLQYAEKSSLISKEQYSEIRKNNMMYAPFQRTMEKEKRGVAATSGKLQASKPIKRMYGSTRNIIAPIESILKNTYAIIINSEKNMSGKVLAALSEMQNMGAYIERVPPPVALKGKFTGEETENHIIKHLVKTGQTALLEMDEQGKWMLREDLKDLIPDLMLKFGAGTYPAGENIVTVYFEGKPRYYQVSPEIFEMWTKGIEPYTAGLITKILRIPARTLRAGAILNPKFIQNNFIRDTWGGFLFTKYGKSIKNPVNLFTDTLYQPLANLAMAARQGPLYVEWMKAGGGMSTMQSLDRESVFKKLQEVRHGYSPLQVMKWLRKVAEISEESNRLAEFGRALAVEGDTRIGREIAAFASRDLSIDFAKMGLQVKALNQVIPFFNATIQGGDKLIRSTMSEKDRKEFILRAISLIALPSLIFAWLNSKDERIKEFQEQEKDFNFITFIGDYALKIPVPFETGVLVHGLTQRLFNYFMSKDADAFEGFIGSIKDAALPNIYPSFANPFIEAEANKNFFTGGRIIPYAKERLISKYQYTTYTSVTARLLGRAMSYMTGEDTTSKYASPAIIDHFIRSWTGGLGSLVVKIADEGLEMAGLGDKIPKPYQSIVDRFDLNAFTRRYPRSNTSSIEKFYNMYADAMKRKQSLKYAKQNELESEESLERANRRTEKIYDYITLDRAYRAMKQSQRAINAIYLNPDMDSKEKRKMIDDLYLEQIQFAKEAISDVKKYRLDQK